MLVKQSLREWQNYKRRGCFHQKKKHSITKPKEMESIVIYIFCFFYSSGKALKGRQRFQSIFPFLYVTGEVNGETFFYLQHEYHFIFHDQ